MGQTLVGEQGAACDNPQVDETDVMLMAKSTPDENLLRFKGTIGAEAENARWWATHTSHAQLANKKFLWGMERFTECPAFPAYPDEGTIKQALSQAQFDLLAMCLTHFTDDDKWLGKTEEKDRAEVEAAILAELMKLKKTQAALPPPDKLKSFDKLVQATGRPMPGYAYPDPAMTELRPLGQDFIMDEMRGYVDEDYSDIPQSLKDKFHVVICGSGVCGINLAIRLRVAGIPFTLLEKFNGVGGTWFLNVYPNVGCDTSSHMYCYSFDPNLQWTKWFAKGQENHRYLMSLVEKYDLKANIKLGCEVKEAVWDEKNSKWVVEYVQDGKTRNITSDVYVSCVGMLSNPNVPNVEGRETFKGTQMHTSRFKPATELKGKRIALVGTGASGMQIGPELAKVAKELTIFQSTPQWFLEIPNYKTDISLGERWCFENVPFYERWHRFKLLRHLLDQYYAAMLKDSDLNQAYHKLLSAHIEKKLEGKPDLLKKVMPNYPPICTRLLVDNNWCELVSQDNVNLVTERVVKVTENTLIGKEGTKAEVDVVVWATGFKSTQFLLPAMNVKGKGGLQIKDYWGVEPSAHLGMTCPNFPNFFMTYGPNSNVSAGGSIVWVGENQARYITQCCGAMVRKKLKVMEVKKNVYDNYQQEVIKALGSTVWEDKRCTSWYKVAHATKVTCNSPWPLEEYWRRTKQANLDDFYLTPRETEEEKKPEKSAE